MYLHWQLCVCNGQLCLCERARVHACVHLHLLKNLKWGVGEREGIYQNHLTALNSLSWLLAGSPIKIILTWLLLRLISLFRAILAHCLETFSDILYSTFASAFCLNFTSVLMVQCELRGIFHYILLSAVVSLPFWPFQRSLVSFHKRKSKYDRPYIYFTNCSTSWKYMHVICQCFIEIIRLVVMQ